MTTLDFDNTYARLPDRFFARVDPAIADAPTLIAVNGDLAGELGFDPGWLAGAEGLDFVSGRVIASGSEPIATAYAGHQFGNFVPQLGDGRAILLGEIIDRQGRRRDIQLKGSGRTPFSRRGDGLAALGPVLREYLVSEAMAALGVPTTRSLAASLTGGKVQRERALPGAVLVRVAASHIRVGTFQFFAARQDNEGVRILADHVIARHYPEAAEADQPYRALLRAIVAAQADLIARWMLVGFIHGVMNTDNMSIAGETIDYGPCAFLDAYDPATVFSSIDQHGRYAFGNQPRIALWDLARLAETLLPLLADDTDEAIAIAEVVLAEFQPIFEKAHGEGMIRKLGLLDRRDGDVELVRDMLAAMQRNRVDFTLFFRRLSDAVEPAPHEERVRELFIDPTEADQALGAWRARLAQDGRASGAIKSGMDSVNPAYIPRNHRIEAVIQAAEQGDFAPFEELREVLARPFDARVAFAAYETPPGEHERVRATFCGT
ncbi:protein adenylyltransferase SelO [Novosphingobium sp. JCM 18896]|uniref:protein adenylyltransferase SelO n=1 Tax=Novosphingobium sp. JCM 18896 TaxID=2989731 RepID=UPI0022216B1E|nr:YdiU family protein [Novosphingobium sp. JCM 18896]MCW1430260.1 YdiU family protein [Novosphingobium sp. JCM 18896]